jgi:AcrR family transcriptional regulator
MGDRGDRARTALIDHAERLFAEHGIEAVSLRDVSKAAGQRNHSAAQYYFGDRAGLIAAVYEARMSIINARRGRLVAEARSHGREHDLETLVAAIVEPLMAVVAEANGWYGRFLARTRWSTFANRVLADLTVTSGLHDVFALLNEALADTPPLVRRTRIEHLNTLVVGTMAGWEWARDRHEHTTSPDFVVSDLITTSVAILTAPARTPAFT